MSSEQTPSERRNDRLAEKVVKSLKSRHFEAFYCKTSAEAIEKVLSLIPEGDIVSWGGSETIRTMGLTRRIHEGPYTVLDRDLATTPEEKMQFARDALLCDTYLASVNALSEDGQSVNVDGNGNRVAAIAFGPKSVILVVGMNKIVKTLDDALSRARNVASPLNVQRFPALKTPCMTTGSCEDCKSVDSICCSIVTTRISRPAGRIKVVLVGECLGY